MKRTATAFALLASLAMLQGCGGEGDKADSGSSTASSSSTSIDSNAFAKAKGKAIYTKTCIACHGEGGVGVENLGKSWIESEFIKTKSDDELLAFIRAGRPIDDPMSAGNAPMPPSGGDPTLSDEDLRNVIVYMRSLQK